MFIGDELMSILEAIESGTAYKGKEKLQMEVGVTVLPHFPKDLTDRNRTSPFAFTGNKFEFRMPGSALSIAWPNIVLNTIIAEVLSRFADSLESAAGSDQSEGSRQVNTKDFTGDLTALVKKTFSEHKRIIFNGNNYSPEWIEEAQKRGLSNLKTTVDALPQLNSRKSIELFSKHNVFNESEINSRYEILLDAYCKTLHIEALTMTEMVKSKIIPACFDYQRELIDLLRQKKAYGGFDVSLEDYFLKNITMLSANLLKKLTALESCVLESAEHRGTEILAQAVFYRDRILSAMSELRLVTDELETFIARKHWTLPVYAEILYSVI